VIARIGRRDRTPALGAAPRGAPNASCSNAVVKDMTAFAQHDELLAYVWRLLGGDRRRVQRVVREERRVMTP